MDRCVLPSRWTLRERIFVRLNRGWSRAAVTAAIVLCAAPVVCRAQARFTLEEAVDTALRSRSLLKAEAERVNVAEGRKRQVGLAPNPEFEFGNENLRSGQTYSRDVDTLASVTWPLDILGKLQDRKSVV